MTVYQREFTSTAKMSEGLIHIIKFYTFVILMNKNFFFCVLVVILNSEI